jgi:hypothetical protein
MFKIKSQDIRDFPFDDYAEPLTNKELLELSQHHRLSNYNSWMMPQISAYFGSWKLHWNQSGLVDHRKTCKENMTNPWSVGVWRVVTQLKRSALVHQQNHPDMANYSQLVPIILASHKRYSGVPYQRWDVDATTTVIDPKLREAMFFRDATVLGLSKEELIQLREQGLTQKSGDRKGTVLKATHQWCLRGMGSTILGQAPALVGTMLCQIWVCHPTLRTPYMVLDPQHWDQMPDPLLSDEIFDTRSIRTDTQPSLNTVPLPWEV